MSEVGCRRSGWIDDWMKNAEIGQAGQAEAQRRPGEIRPRETRATAGFTG